MRVIDVIFTSVYLEDISYKNKYRFICNYPCKVGDMLEDGFHSNPIQVIDILDTEKDEINGVKLKEYYPTKVNNKPVKLIMQPVKSYAKSSMFDGLLGKYASQYVPEEEPEVKMSWNGTLCVPVDGEYVSIDTNNELVTYDPSMTIDAIPVFSINKPVTAVAPGDIIKSGKSFAKVLSVNADGSLKTLSYTGYSHTKKASKDFLLGQTTVRCLINMFNFNGDGFNPIVYAIATGKNIDMQSLMVLSMTPQGKNLFGNTGGGFSWPLFMLLDKNKKDESNNSMLEGMMMMSMMNGQQNPFSNLFGSTTKKETVKDTPTKEDKINDKLDKLTEAVSSLVSGLNSK